MKRSLGCIFSLPRQTYESAGIVRKDGAFVLDKTYRQPVPFIIYYGAYVYSGLTDYSVYGMMVASDKTVEEILKARACGTKIFQYLPYGSRFNTDGFITEMKTTIKGLADLKIADGIFLDECEVGYWGDYYDNDEMAAVFENGLKEICDYCMTLGLETIVNGVSGYATYGTYFLWESFSGYWNTNKLNWNGTGTGQRTVNADSTIEYTYNFSNWTMTGSLRVENGMVVDGSDGTMSITINMNDLIIADDRSDTYPWVYFEWFGSGADDNTLEIYASVGNTWPYDAQTWEELPKLWKGEPASWDGINEDTRYIRLELRFNGADDLRMERCFLAYDYVYPYYDMTQSNGTADTNHRQWNFNLAQARYLWEQKAKVLCHCYGTPKDTDRMKYTFAVYKTFCFDAWDYTHPLHQTIRYTDILDDPFGAFLSRTEVGNGVFTGAFTGCTTRIDVKNNTYEITRDEPGYWFDRGLRAFEEVDVVYENPLSITRHVFQMQAQVPASESIPGLSDGWYVVNVVEGAEYHTVQYYPVLSDDLNLRKVWIYDDIFYFYFGMKFRGAPDFLAAEPNQYYVYIGSEELDYGYTGEWFSAPFKAQFMIYNQSLFKWDKDAADETDYQNFHYIGNAFLSHEFTEDGTMLTYTLKKSVLGEASTQQMSFYFVVQDRANNYVSIFPTAGIDSTTSPVTVPNKISYSQRKWNLNTPHGYYRSEEIPFWKTVQGAYVYCNAQSEEPTTSVKLFVRVKQAGHEDFDAYEEAEGLHYATDKQITHIQYAVALNTTDGYETPSVSDVRIVAGPELEPGPYQEHTANIYIGTVLAEKIEYAHGERNSASL